MGFKRTVEDFVCEHCATENRGNGYTNHCYRCLYSKHVDIEPGDRASRCGGLMSPVGVLVKGDRYTLLHQCATCGHQQRCRTGPRDDPDAILAAAPALPRAPGPLRRHRPT